MSSLSTVPAVKSRLVEVFKAATDETTLVWLNRPNEDHDLAENVHVGTRVRERRQWKSIGRKPMPMREQNYTVDVEVAIFRTGTDMIGIETRLNEVLAQLEGALEEDVTLGVANVRWTLIETVETTAPSGPNGIEANAVLGIAVNARM